MYTMVPTLRETGKQSDWPSVAKIAPHMHKVEKIATRIAARHDPQCTTQAIHLAPLEINGKHVVACIASLQWTRTVSRPRAYRPENRLVD